MSRIRVPFFLLLAATSAGCINSVIREFGPDNDETIVSLPDSLTYLATNLENVSDRVGFEWTNSEPRLQINHQSFLPHGYGLLIIRDAVGAVVDSTLLEYQLVTESRAGVPGLWTVTIIYAAAWGRAQFSLVPLPADASLRGDPQAAKTTKLEVLPVEATEPEEERHHRP
jgi:hypothetical protein